MTTSIPPALAEAIEKIKADLAAKISNFTSASYPVSASDEAIDRTLALCLEHLTPRWRSIEEAPRVRGKSILVHCTSNHCSYTACWWQDTHGNWSWHYYGGGGGPMSEEPTHFQPLPAPEDQR